MNAPSTARKSFFDDFVFFFGNKKPSLRVEYQVEKIFKYEKNLN